MKKRQSNPLPIADNAPRLIDRLSDLRSSVTGERPMSTEQWREEAFSKDGNGWEQDVIGD